MAALALACSVLEPVDDYGGPPATEGDASSGGSVGDASITDAKCETDDDCDDQSPCTLDGCWGNLCTHAPLPDAPCPDGNVCNGDERCDAAGECKPGEPLGIDDGNACTDDACDPVKGVTHTAQLSPPMQILQCGSVICPSGYFVRKLSCLSECGACNPTFCVNGVLCERVCGPKLEVCCGNQCGDDCPAGYAQTATSSTGDCGCGPGPTATCQR